ncbi:MAG TPA: methyltransferase domain-containing protein [Dongiaceae bacterium]|nr:methyltransferase domain-containing protein [Dongiaceae bacterium]
MQPLAWRDYVPLLTVSGVFLAAILVVDVCIDQSGRPVAAFIFCGFVIFWTFPILAWTQRAKLRGLWDHLSAVADAAGSAVAARRGLVSLFAISFVVLFVEMALIRYVGSQTRIFAFYKNIPLIGAFLGLGSGCFRGKGGGREALLALAAASGIVLFFAVAAQSLGAILGATAALASTERVFGYGIVNWTAPTLLVRLVSDLHLGLYCAAVFLGLAYLFHQLGRILGEQFEGLPKIPAYSVNILGSLAGLAGFVLLSSLHLSPWLWFLIGFAPLLYWLRDRRARRIGGAFVVATALFGAFGLHYTVWSAYQKLVGRDMPHGYRIDISDAFYQAAFDLSPKSIQELGYNPLPHYEWEFEGRGNADRVLIVGAGSGNDVAAALRSGARHVDAVDIDGAIVELGREHHPERPYADPRVNVILDDARNAFKTLPLQSYDVLVFGLLDSHTQLGTSSVRLDNYVFTQEGFSSAARLLKPGGTLILSVVTATDWLSQRFAQMLERACGSAVQVRQFPPSTMYTCQPAAADPDPGASGRALGAPVDDWPFPYLPDRAIPESYIVVIGFLVVASVLWLRRHGIGRVEADAANAHMFFLGAAFLLMEVYAINRLALLFGTTWLVSAVSIAAMLIEILAANLIVSLVRFDLRPYAYAALGALLIAGYAIGPETVLGKGMAVELAYALFLLSPVLCAGIIFATSFSRVPSAGAALGANILGAVLGGWAEYGTMVTGIRFMALVALALYAASLIALIASRRRLAAAPASAGR